MKISVLVSCFGAVVEDLVLIPVHTKPEDSLKELDELHDVVEAVRKHWGSDVSQMEEPTIVNVIQLDLINFIFYFFCRI